MNANVRRFHARRTYHKYDFPSLSLLESPTEAAEIKTVVGSTAGDTRIVMSNESKTQEHHTQIEKLGKHIDLLSKALAGLSRTDDLQELIVHIRRPGWTTPAEIAFALSAVESLNAQVNALVALKGALVNASKLVAVR
jgi:hypothetical protein